MGENRLWYFLLTLVVIVAAIAILVNDWSYVFNKLGEN